MLMGARLQLPEENPFFSAGRRPENKPPEKRLDRSDRILPMFRSACILGVWGVWLACTGAAHSALAADGRPRIVAHRGAMTQRPECTLAAIRRAIEVGAHVVELDVRTSKDGVLFLLHDPTLDRTTDGTGLASQRTMAQLKQLDAGSYFGKAYRGERIPTLAEALTLCRGRIEVLLDLKEQGDENARRLARTITKYGQPQQTILGVRSLEQAQRLRRLLPQCRQLGFIRSPQDIDPFVNAGAEIIRLWPDWIKGPEGKTILSNLKKKNIKFQINAKTGRVREILPLLRFEPDFLLVDDPATLKETLSQVERHKPVLKRLERLMSDESGVTVVPWVVRQGAISFLNRDYRMLRFPQKFEGLPRILFAGGEGDRVKLRFLQPVVVFAALEYNATGAWSFPENLPPQAFGWKRLVAHGYRGTSNPVQNGKPHFAHVYYRIFPAHSRLENMPPWWLCLGIVDLKTAAAKWNIDLTKDGPSSPVPFLYTHWATKPRPLAVPKFHDGEQWARWQQAMRKEFRRRLVFSYDAPAEIRKIGSATDRGAFLQQEFHVFCNQRRLFRFFRLMPKSAYTSKNKRLPTIVCFMGHGKVSQILSQRDSYQHACAARFAEKGYLVFAMENVGMEPERNRHLELDRVLRLYGYGWYSLLFAHQQILLDEVFADPRVDPHRVGTTGVSTGGLLALSAIALDPRVKAASVQGIFGSMRISFIQDRNRHCTCGAIPGLLPEFDLPELALLAAPRPLHISNAAQDSFTPAEALRCVGLITPLYRKIGGPAPVFTQPPGGHEYAFEPAWQFFQNTIGKPE